MLFRSKVDGVNYLRETMTSFTDQVVTVRVTADKPGKITCTANFTSPHQDVMIETEGGEISLTGVSSWHEGLKGKVDFQGRMAAGIKGGKQIARDGVISVEGADEAIFYVSISTNFNNYKDITGDHVARAKGYLHKAMKRAYADNKHDHVKYFKSFMDRNSLDQIGRAHV